MKILLVEDDERIATVLAQELTTYHYNVETAVDGQTGLQLAQAFHYDLLVLDIMLPYLDGITLCRQMRSQGLQTPILLLSAKDSSTDRVMGLEAGADDYVVKPYEIHELIARIQALLRRGSSTLPPILTWEKLQLNPDACQVTYDGTVLRLTPKEYSILELFLRNPQRIFSRSAIIDHIWLSGECPQEDAVSTQVKGLRQKLKAAGMTTALIETVYGLGYRLKAPPDSPTHTQLRSDRVVETNSGDGETGRRGENEVLRMNASRCQKLPQEQVSAVDAPFVLSVNDAQGERSSDAPNVATASLTRSHPVPVNAEEKRQAQAKVLAVVQQMWENFKESLGSQMALFEQAAAQLSTGTLDRELRTLAQAEAHRLIGSLGSFGLPQGSEVARQIEQLLNIEPLGQNEARQLEVWVRRLKQVVDSKPSPTSGSFDLKTASGRLLVVDDDQVLTQQVKQEALACGLQVEVAANLSAARQVISQHPPDIIVLDLTFPETPENGLTLLAELEQCTPTLPVLVMTGRNQLSDRVEVARLGGDAFLHKPITPQEILKAVTQHLNRTQKAQAKVLIVDDDQQVLNALSMLLEPWGLQVTTLVDPQQFWQILEASAPDLLILDIEMPHFSGIELCQVVRHDPHWSQLPILFLSSHQDAKIVHQVFAVGADDYIHKPIVGPELIARILNRLERIRILQKVARIE